VRLRYIENAGNTENVTGLFMLTLDTGRMTDGKCGYMEVGMNYIDMHCDTLEQALVYGKNTLQKLPDAMVDVERLQQAGAAAQFFAMFLPQRKEPAWFGRKEMPELTELMGEMFCIYQNTLKECADVLAPAVCYEDLMKNREEGKISAFLTMENGFLIQGKLENIRRFYDMGVRLITLTWNDANCLGYPHSAKREEMEKGLTPFGKEAVSCMNELGILVDVSHLSDGGFYDVADVAAKPFVASHSNCREISPATRNLTDDMIRILAEHGGVAGINLEPSFLNPDVTDRKSHITCMCDHVEHLIRVGGVECVGIGSDFDGIGGEFEIADCTGMEQLFYALSRRGISEDVIDKIAFSNVARVIRDVM
jgi:membrane dipeptidase